MIRMINRNKKGILYFTLSTCIIALISFSCKTSDNQYYIISERAEGLKEGSEIRSNGSPIGRIEYVSFYNNKVLLTLSLAKDTKLSIKSEFILESADFFTNVVEVTHINVSPLVNVGDTLTRNIERNSIPIEKIDSISKQFIDTIRVRLDKKPINN